MKKLAQLLIIGGVFAVAPFANAQDDMGPKQGSKSVSFNSLYDDIGGTKSTTLNLAGSYFFTGAVEGLAGLTFSELKSGGTIKLTTFGIGANYYFGNNVNSVAAWHPYLGIRFARMNLEVPGGSGHADEWAGALGMHYFIKPGVSVNPELRVGRVNGGGISDRLTSFGVGLTIWLD